MNIKGIKRIFENRKGITAISLAASIVSGNLIGIVIGNAISENRENSDRDNLSSNYSQSENVEVSNNIFDDPETEYLNIFDIQMDETKIVKISDKNGIDITKYVKNCSITKTEESKIYLDNGYIIYYDQDGFKYIKGDIYKEKDDHTKTKIVTNVIAYVDKDTNQVIGYDNCENMYYLGVNHEKIVNELLNDNNYINLYRKRYNRLGEIQLFYGSDLVETTNYENYVGNMHSTSDVVGLLHYYDDNEEEFEKIFGFPLYVTNKDGLRIYNIYIDCKENSFFDESKEIFIKKIKDELNKNNSACIRLNTWVDVENDEGTLVRKMQLNICNSYIEEINDDGDLILVNNDNSKIIVKYEDLINNDQHYSVEITT